MESRRDRPTRRGPVTPKGRAECATPLVERMKHEPDGLIGGPSGWGHSGLSDPAAKGIRAATAGLVHRHGPYGDPSEMVFQCELNTARPLRAIQEAQRASQSGTRTI